VEESIIEEQDVGVEEKEFKDKHNAEEEKKSITEEDYKEEKKTITEKDTESIIAGRNSAAASVKPTPLPVTRTMQSDKRYS